MIPQQLRPLFWDVSPEQFDPRNHPDYAIFRVLELGDGQAVAWMRENFSEAQVIRVIRAERRLSPKSANFWALVYNVPVHEVAAFRRSP